MSKPREWTLTNKFDYWIVEKPGPSTHIEPLNSQVQVIEKSAYDELVEVIRDISKTSCSNRHTPSNECGSCLAADAIRELLGEG